MKLPQRAKQEDRRREFALWILLSVEASSLSIHDAIAAFEGSFVGEQSKPTPLEATPYFQLERIDDYLPTPDEWKEFRDEVIATVHMVDGARPDLDAAIRKASPRWRIERMPLVDRTLLRIGAAELMVREKPRPRATFNGLIELAKRYGEQQSPKFVNGILDEIRRNLNIPFR